MRRASVLALLSLAVVAGGPTGTAVAADPWGPTVQLGPPVARTGNEPVLAGGRMVWAEVSEDARRQGVQAGGRIAGLRGTDVAVVYDNFVIDAAPAVYGTGRAVFPRVQLLDRRLDAPLVRLGANLGTTTFLGTDRWIATVRLVEGPVVAASERGDAVLAWIERVGDEQTRLRISRRPAGGRFGAPGTVRGAGTQHGLTVAVGGRGRFVVAYGIDYRERNRRPRRAFEVRSGGVAGGVRTRQVLGANKGLVQADAVIAPNGRTTIAWATQDLGEQADEAQDVLAVTRSTDDPSFRPAQVLELGTLRARADADVVVAAQQSGRAVVAWSSPIDEARAQVRVARQGAGLRFRAAETLDGAGRVEGLAVGEGDRAVVAWRGADGRGLRVADAAPPLGPWSASEVVTEDRVDGADVGWVPGTGRPLAVWTTGAEVRLSVRRPR